MRRGPLLAAAALVAASLLAAPVASAHQGSPEYLSIVRDVSPTVPGLSVVMLDRGDRLQVTNEGPEQVVFMGYSGEPYLRFLPSGVVQRNALSPATFLNVDPTGGAPVPAGADAKAPPRWVTVSRDGRYEFHDHRIHWMGKQRPPIVTDPDKKTKVQDWRVPIEVSGRTPGAVTGTLYWTPIDGGGAPVAAIVALVVLLVGAVILVVVVRRRRGPARDDDEDDTSEARPVARQREAW